MTTSTRTMPEMRRDRERGRQLGLVGVAGHSNTHGGMMIMMMKQDVRLSSGACVFVCVIIQC
jgi:hypothetical protein